MELADRVEQIALRSQHAGDPVAFFEHVGSRLRRGQIAPDPWQKRMLASGSKRKLLLTSRQAGKSTTLAALALHKAVFTPEALVLILAPTERQAKITFAKVARLYMAYGGEVDATSVRRMGLEFANGSQIEALPGSPNTIQGFTADLIIIDEAGIIVDELYTVIRPSLAVTGGELVMASKAYQARGVFYKEWTEGGEVWHREEVRADDPNECPRITPEFLAEERAHMMAHEYA